MFVKSLPSSCRNVLDFENETDVTPTRMLIVGRTEVYGNLGIGAKFLPFESNYTFVVEPSCYNHRIDHPKRLVKGRIL